MIERLALTVHGAAVPQGSKTARPIGGGRWGVVDDKRADLDRWRGEIAERAAEVFEGPMIEGPVRLRVVFVRVRPAGHFTSRGLLSSAGAALRARLAPCTKPDLGKTTRGVEDALTGLVWRDDSQIVWLEQRKVWGERERVLILVEELEPSDLEWFSEWLPLEEHAAAHPPTPAEAREAAGR